MTTIDTNGWDLVYATSYTNVNTEIATQWSSLIADLAISRYSFAGLTDLNVTSAGLAESLQIGFTSASQLGSET
ncbi:hypothetical protein FVEN_g12883 [Fusarium venenatum]|uniref:Uncharacterized protein n=1 Tax=Fusarium venenatum TaxID=56646 RepID=A0A2L2TGU2_9HYPO|nr:uncharacterized protein FVRRES_00149 [Fusarium venenatum]KAG8355461.1 hypothetical protein FVEN_g12883 [Fusarium venenatum]CEI63637.1 unnamed protein product [Fusarium venenatum]